MNTILSTKISMPRLSAKLVKREALTERLDAAAQLKFTLVSAAAGFGKTTLVADWLQGRKQPHAWFSIDEDDNDFARFFSYVIAAIQKYSPTFMDRSHAMLQARQSIEPEVFIDVFINDLMTGEEAFTLVLEDYHVITERDIHEAINFLLDHLPSHVHLTIITRADPPFSLSRLRVQGQMAEIRVDDLRFSREETGVFFREIAALDLDDRIIEQLDFRTEGWIATLQLAGLSLQNGQSPEAFVQAFSGSQRYVVDYLMDEVLAGQPEYIQTFLIHTAVLDRLCGPLCEALVSAESAGQVTLDYLEQHNLFLIPLDQERQWYRYHHLFAEFLRQRLSATQELSLPDLHQRASVWFEQNGWMDEAIDHAILANDYARAGDLVQSIASDLVVKNEIPVLLGWIRKLPEEVLATRPMLTIGYAWGLFFQLDFANVEPLLALAESAKDHMSDRPISAQANILRAFICSAQNDHNNAIMLNKKALEQLDQVAEEEAAHVRGVATFSLANAYMYSGELDTADLHYRDAMRLTRQTGNDLAYYFSLGCRAQKEMIEGRLHSAEDLLGPGRDALQDSAIGIRIAAYVPLRLCELNYEWNRLDRMESTCRIMVESGEMGISPEAGVAGYAMMALLRYAEDHSDEACVWLKRMDRLCDRLVHLPDHALRTSQVPGMTVRLLLACRYPSLRFFIDDVARWVERAGEIDLDAFTLRMEPQITVAVRLRLIQRQYDQALAMLDRLIPSAHAGGRTGHMINYHVLQALACEGIRRHKRALEALATAVRLGEPEGYVRTFLDGGPVILNLLQEMEEEPAAYRTRLVEAFAQTTKTDEAAIPVTTAVPIASSDAYDALIEPLKERELTILGYMRGPLTKNEIAHELFLSENTIKWYIKQIYEKLGVNTRRKAVERGLQLGLISS